MTVTDMVHAKPIILLENASVKQDSLVLIAPHPMHLVQITALVTERVHQACAPARRDGPAPHAQIW